MTQPAAVYASSTIKPPSVPVPANANSPVKVIKSSDLQTLGNHLGGLFGQYKSDRRLVEMRWLRNQRQYLGVYDPDVEATINKQRSRAYPRITRVRCISVLSRLMNLMFQGDERSWELKAAPWPDMTIDEVTEAIQQAQAKDQAGGTDPDTMDEDWLNAAVATYTQKRAKKLSDLIDDQMQELGGDQTEDYVSLNRRALQSGILYGLGVLRGPHVRETKGVTWDLTTQPPTPKRLTKYMPVFEWLPVWDFYPDMTAKKFKQMDGYFIRKIMSRSMILDLKDKPGFFSEQIDQYLSRHTVGNYRPDWFETELRAMGVKANVNEQKVETTKYEILAWHGKCSGEMLTLAGCEVSADKMGLELDAEIWMIDGNVIKADLNPWDDLGVDMTMIHEFLFDEDDTSPLGFGLPNAMRDSQMAVAAATRMLMDNASVVCGPQLEINYDLLRLDQDLESIGAYKIWVREGQGIEAQWPAVRNIQIDAHIEPLLKVIDYFMKMADQESFVGPNTGGDASQAPSEPMRTAAGASMLRADASLPFKDMCRAFDKFTTSIVSSMVKFNRVFNPKFAPDGEYDVIAKGATSLMARELRGMQADNLVQTLTPDELIYVDAKKLLQVRLSSRDMADIMVDDAEAGRRLAQQSQTQSQTTDTQNQLAQANIRKLLSDAYKGVTQGQKNTAAGDADTVNAVMQLLEKGMMNGLIQPGAGVLGASASGAGPSLQLGGPQPAGGPSVGDDQIGSGPGQAGALGGPGGDDALAGGGQGV